MQTLTGKDQQEVRRIPIETNKQTEKQRDWPSCSSICLN